MYNDLEEKIDDDYNIVNNNKGKLKEKKGIWKMMRNKKKIAEISKEEMEDFEDLEDLKVYLNDLIKNKKEYISRLSDNEDNFIGVCYICFFTMIANVFILAPVFSKNFLLGLGIYVLIPAGIMAISSIADRIEAKRKINREIKKVSLLIEEKQKEKDMQEQDRENENESDKKQENTMVDKFIANIAKDIETIVNVKYDGYEKDLLALKSLAKIYLDEKRNDIDNYSLDRLSVNPKHYSILVGIEDSMHNSIKFKQIQDANIAKLIDAFGNEKVSENDEIMDSDELNQYIISNKHNSKQRLRTL